MRKPTFYFLSALLIICLFFSIPLNAFNSHYTGAQLPSEDLILNNLKTLLGPASTDVRKHGNAQMILGTHFRQGKNIFQLYYCYEKPRKNIVYGTRPNDGCFSDVILYRLETNLWIMKNTINSEWIIVSYSPYKNRFKGKQKALKPLRLKRF